MTFDPKNQEIFIADKTTKNIYHFASGKGQMPIVKNCKDPSAVAVDWINRNLYWADNGSNKILVTGYDGKYQKTIQGLG
jgi:hypothetical protein